jgi:hypothetical protein
VNTQRLRGRRRGVGDAAADARRYFVAQVLQWLFEYFQLCQLIRGAAEARHAPVLINTCG